VARRSIFAAISKFSAGLLATASARPFSRIRTSRKYWLDDKELRLNIYREHEVAPTYNSVELRILTKASDEGVYDGRYTLAVYDAATDTEKDGKPLEVTGKVSCGAE